MEKEPVFVELWRLGVRALREDEYERAGPYFADEPYLGDLRRGRCLLQAVEPGDRWGVLLDWDSAAWKLADRESRIGWTAPHRGERIGLMVQNRRFLVFGATPMPSLASKALPDHREATHGYRPLLA